MTQEPDVNQPAMQAPTCPRHPDRVAMVSCQRCGRPACAECQRPAAVGVQCVDCVNQGKRETPRQVSVFGGGLAQGRPVVTIGLIAICAVVWVAQRLDPTVTDNLLYAPILSKEDPWRFLTAAFVHSPYSPFHLLFNMYALWICGQYLEPLLGRARFLALYLISAIGGSVGYELLASTPSSVSDQVTGWNTPTVGASGAVFGLFLAVVVLNRRLGREIGPMVTLIAINAVIGFVVPNVAWQAHLGGAITGGVCAGAIALLGRERRQWQWVALAGIVVVLAVLAAVRFESVHLPTA
ncbi:rhomboid family intramembrane serine protease [Flexivirga sp. ID2601S]|uniref:Rhomboid family intramembrane serine protease n=1 Tax=Flexivirga aerilata TaxID=1656889 RepID=A0A849AGK3_9MICO|nr:rhomboid family intramembrane serine protease [Flexivirga aerilata]NNG38401.1 rhomboid family intramembrane serine protease [Flexivirga aerilata]